MRYAVSFLVGVVIAAILILTFGPDVMTYIDTGRTF
jgi:hypothetical protein